MSDEREGSERKAGRQSPQSEEIAGNEGAIGGNVHSSADVNAHASNDLKRVNQITPGYILNGTFEITRLISRVECGQVYEARNIHSGDERVIITIFSLEGESNGANSAEVTKIAAKLTLIHDDAIVPHLLAARDVDGRPFLVTKCIDASSLAKDLNKIRLTDEKFGSFARRLACGLEAAHDFDVIHRNIEPKNILLIDGDVGQAKVFNFNIGDGKNRESKALVADGVHGNLKYIAPEQLGDFGGRIGAWTDLYSLALTMLAVASGQDPDMGESIVDAVRKRLTVPDLSAIPTLYRSVFESALQPDPAKRPQSMSDFIALIDRVGSSTADHLVRSVPQDEKSSPSPRPAVDKPLGEMQSDGGNASPIGKRFVLGAAGVSILLLGIVAGIYAILGSDGDLLGTSDSNSPAEAENVAALIGGVPCSWLSIGALQGSVASLVGGTGNPTAAKSMISDGLSAELRGTVTLNMSDVVDFDPSMCGTIEALREFRSPDGLISAAQRVYEAEEQSITLTNGAKLGEGFFARPMFQISGLEDDDDVILIVIEANTAMQPLFNSRRDGATVIQLLSGVEKRDGFEIPYPTELLSPPKESFGIAVVAGKGPFPATLFGDANDTQPRVPLDETWPAQFRAEARANGWRTDIFWFSVADDEPG